MSARMALGGFHLILDWEQSRDGTVSFSGHGVLGWDERGTCYTMHWFDSMGVEHGAPHLGTWEGPADGGTLTLTHETTHLGQSHQVYAVAGDELRFELLTSPDGREWQTFQRSRYRR